MLDIALQEFYQIVIDYNQKNTEKIFWILTWSLSLAIQWVNVTPSKDIDILTDQKWAEKLDILLAKYVVKKSEYSTTDKFKSFFWIYKIHEVQLEVMGDIQHRKKDWSRLQKHRIDATIYKKYKWMNLPMFSLEQELEAYENLWRNDKAEKIREKLNASDSQ